MNESIKQSAREALKRRKKGVSSSVISFLGAATGFFIARMFFVNGPDVFAIVSGAFATAAFLFFRTCTAYKMQVQMILLLSGIKKVKIGFSEYLRNVRLSFCLFALKTAELIAFEFIPATTLLILFLKIRDRGVSLKLCITVLAGAAVLAVFGAVFYAFSVQKYSKALFLLAAYPMLSVTDCIKLSMETGEKRAAEMLRFKLGFLPWWLACVAVFPLLFVVPYYKQSLTCFFKRVS